jgi:hypothetical protein
MKNIDWPEPLVLVTQGITIRDTVTQSSVWRSREAMKKREYVK